MSDYQAIFVSDIHLSAKPPALRHLEPNWFEAMARPIREMRRLAEKLDVPVICGGDIFDFWNPPAELISFAIQELPKLYAVPGQHATLHAIATAPSQVTRAAEMDARLTFEDVQLFLAFDPSTREVAARGHVTLRNTGSRPIDSVQLSASYAVTWLEVSAAPNKVRLGPAGSIELPLPAQLPTDHIAQMPACARDGDCFLHEERSI